MVSVTLSPGTALRLRSPAVAIGTSPIGVRW
jgi:hypothetical protein